MGHNPYPPVPLLTRFPLLDDSIQNFSWSSPHGGHLHARRRQGGAQRTRSCSCGGGGEGVALPNLYANNKGCIFDSVRPQLLLYVHCHSSTEQERLPLLLAVPHAVSALPQFSPRQGFWCDTTFFLFLFLVVGFCCEFSYYAASTVF